MSDQEEQSSSNNKRAHEPDNKSDEEDDDNDEWIGPLPTDAAPVKKRKGITFQQQICK